MKRWVLKPIPNTFASYPGFPRPVERGTPGDRAGAAAVRGPGETVEKETAGNRHLRRDGMVPAYLSERFATQRRASGVGFGYSSGLFIGAWIPLYAIPLYTLFYPIEDGNIWFTASFFTILAAVLYGIGAFLGPETRGVSMRDVRERLR